MIGLAGLAGACAEERDGGEDARAEADGLGDAGEADEVGADELATESSGDTDGELEAEAGPTEATWVEALIEGREIALTAGRSAALTFDVPADALAVSITVVGQAPTLYALDAWTTPDATLVPSGWLASDPGAYLELCTECANRIWAIPGVFTAFAPDAPEVDVAPGTHTVTLLSDPPTAETVRVWVHLKRAHVPDAPVPATATLDLNLYFTGAQGLTAASARTDGHFQATLAAVAEVYAQADVTLGSLTYRDIDARFRDIESISGADSDMAALFASGRDDPAAANLYFVDSIFEGANFFGYSGGIPGPTALDGTGRSGVAIALKPVPGFPNMVTTSVAHELAHFLGLFHASEARIAGKPPIDDALADTPSGPSANLMYFAGTGTTLTPMQGLIMRTSFWARHPTEAP